MLWLLKLLLTLYFIPAKFVCAITVLLLIADTVVGKVIDPTQPPLIESEGVRGCIIVLITSYLFWPYYLYMVFHREKKS